MQNYFTIVEDFEKKIASFFGAPYAIAVDCCTHGIELCLRYTNSEMIDVPTHTYLSIPFLAQKLNINMKWNADYWVNYYYLTDKIIDAAVLWKRNSYIPGTFMCVSFQYQKHLSLGRGGIILTDDKEACKSLKKMSYDGREPNIPWREQNISSIGYHYYMTPETAQRGLDSLDEAITTIPRQWTIDDWPDVRDMEIFKNIIKYYSQARQDEFILHMMNGKVGTYLEIGAGHPIIQNNTYALEQRGWKGISIDVNSQYACDWKMKRKNLFIIADALTYEYEEKEHIDYLQLDIDPTLQTFTALENLLKLKTTYSIITFETDAYIDPSYVEISRELLQDKGYILAVADVTCKDSNYLPFEDWYVNPDFIDIKLINTWKDKL